MFNGIHLPTSGNKISRPVECKVAGIGNTAFTSLVTKGNDG